MDRLIEGVYARHHLQARRYGFSFALDERAQIFSRWIGSGKRVLDIGCRDGVFTRKILPGNMLTGVDIDMAALRMCREESPFPVVQHNFNMALPFKKASFDVVVMGEILEHAVFPAVLLSEGERVLVRGGVLVGSVPNAFRLKNRLLFLLGRDYDRDPTHLHRFSWGTLKRVLSERFEVLEIRGSVGRLSALSGKFFGNQLLFRCRKR